MPAIDLSELLEIEQDDDCPYIKTQKQEIISHQVFIDEEIKDPKYYRNLINMLYLAPETTEINILFNSPGGSMMAAIAIIEAIKVTDAHVRAILNGECHSAASLIAFSCPEVIVTDSAHSLIHTGQYGTGGFIQNVKAHADFSAVHINRILETAYSGFLTTDELNNVKRGVEMWFDADEIRTRLKRKHAFLMKKHKAENKPIKKKTATPTEDVIE